MSQSLQSQLTRLYLNPDDVELRVACRSKQRGIYRPKQRAELVDKPSSSLTVKMAVGGKSDPDEVIRVCEEHLQKNPFDASFLFRLGEAARGGGYFATAVYVFNDILALCRGSQKLVRIEKAGLKALGLSYYGAGDLRNAQKVLAAYEGKYGLDKESDSFRQLVEKDLPARVAALSYEGAESSREVIRRPEEADELAREERGYHTENEKLERVGELEKVLADDNRNSQEKYRAATDASRLCRDLKRYDDAIRLMEAAAGFDSTSQARVGLAELMVAKADHEISALRAQLEEKPESEPLKSKIAAAEKRKWEMVVEIYGALVNKAATDESLQLALGEGHLHLGELAEDQEQVKSAITQFQKRYSKEENGYNAAVLLGKAFARIGVIDLAKRQFRKILDSVSSDDPSRNEIAFRALRELAQVQLDAGDKQGAYESLGEIYFRNRTWEDVEEQYLRLNEELGK